MTKVMVIRANVQTGQLTIDAGRYAIAGHHPAHVLQGNTFGGKTILDGSLDWTFVPVSYAMLSARQPFLFNRNANVQSAHERRRCIVL